MSRPVRVYFSVYDMKDSEQYLGDFTTKEVCEHFKCSRDAIYKTLKRGTLLHRRYKLYLNNMQEVYYE